MRLTSLIPNRVIDVLARLAIVGCVSAFFTLLLVVGLARLPGLAAKSLTARPLLRLAA